MKRLSRGIVAYLGWFATMISIMLTLGGAVMGLVYLAVLNLPDAWLPPISFAVIIPSVIAAHRALLWAGRYWDV